MTTAELKKKDDLFFTCALIDYIARKTTNRRVDVVEKLGKERVGKIYELADVYRCDNIDRVCDDFVAESEIARGTFDNVAAARYSIPSHWDVGKVYARLILEVANAENVSVVDALFRVYRSFVSPLIDDYNGLFYCEPSKNMLNAYLYRELE